MINGIRNFASNQSLRIVAFIFCAIIQFTSPARAAEDERLACADYFNPAQGFKPAQPNLTKIVLQMAGSLECHGTPEPYLRHVISEHKRIDALYKAATGKDGTNRPAYLNDDYVEKLVRNWNQMARPLALDGFSKQSGRNMRYAILGSWNMTTNELVAMETKLDENEKITYRRLLAKDYFERGDFGAMDSFYKVTFDKLSEVGKDQISKRTWRGQMTAEIRNKAIAADKGGTMVVKTLRDHEQAIIAHINNRISPAATPEMLEAALQSTLRLNDSDRDLSSLPKDSKEAIFYAHQIKSALEKRISAVRKQSSNTGQTDEVEKALRAIIGELVVLSQSEFEASLYESQLNQK